MEDIRKRILEKTGLDIAEEENIFRIYKIKSPDIPAGELKEKLRDTLVRWNKSRNSPDENIAKKARRRIENADKYEQILLDKGLCRDLFYYYNKDKPASLAVDAAVLDHAKGFFSLAALTKKLKNNDFEFYSEYYGLAGREKAAVKDMLEKEFHISMDLKNRRPREADSYAERVRKRRAGNFEKSSAEAAKRDDGGIFSRTSVLKLGSCMRNYKSALDNPFLRANVPDLGLGLYDFLGVDEDDTIEEFCGTIADKSRRIYELRQERGTEYLPLVDIFNILNGLADSDGAEDYIEELKLLLRYPELTPYMYLAEVMTGKVLLKMADIAMGLYGFEDKYDFIVSYYEPLSGCFGIDDSAVQDIMDKAAEEKGYGGSFDADEDDEEGGIARTLIHILSRFIGFIVLAAAAVFVLRAALGAVGTLAGGHFPDNAAVEGGSETGAQSPFTGKPEGETAFAYGTMSITVDAANIRSGPGTEYDIIGKGVRNEEFAVTGNELTASDGSTWYEVYLDEDMTKTGWASEKVIGRK